MADFKSEIYKIIKERFLEINPQAKFNKEMVADRKDFYLEDLDDNFLYPLEEADKKNYTNQDLFDMAALYSSAAMAFNLFGKDNLKIKKNDFLPQGLYSIEYEKRFTALKCRGADPQLDVELLLDQAKTALLFEIKMTEWLPGGRETLAEAYLVKGNYFYPESFEIFYQVFQFLIDKSSNIRSIYNNFDAFQMVKHILGIYNAVCQGEYESFDKIKLVNCVWQIKNPSRLDKEVQAQYLEYESLLLKEFEDFRGKLQPIIYLFEEKNVEFDLVYISFDEMLEILEKSDEERQYLQRYII